MKMGILECLPFREKVKQKKKMVENLVIFVSVAAQNS